jgi:hypothetical protein
MASASTGERTRRLGRGFSTLLLSRARRKGPRHGLRPVVLLLRYDTTRVVGDDVNLTWVQPDNLPALHGRGIFNGVHGNGVAACRLPVCTCIQLAFGEQNLHHIPVGTDGVGVPDRFRIVDT